MKKLTLEEELHNKRKTNRFEDESMNDNQTNADNKGDKTMMTSPHNGSSTQNQT